MKRRTKALFAGVGVVVLLGVLGTTVMNASAEFVSPTDVESGDYDGERVNLEGQATDLDERGGEIRFVVEDANASVPVVYEGAMPETLADGRIVVAKGTLDGDTLEASDLSVRAHEGGGNESNESARPPADRN